MPINLASKLNVTYTNQQSTQSPVGEFLDSLTNSENPVNFFDRFGSFGGQLITDTVGDIFPLLAPFGIVESDTNDATFSVAAGRTFTFKYAMIAKDELQAADIAEICQQFKVHSLPTQTGIRSRVQAPPLWSWTGYKKTGLEGEESIQKMSDIEQQVWTDDAQASVLTSVDIDRTGAGGVHPIKVGDAFLPIVTTLTLTFVEIEPLISVDTLDLITNRSGAQMSFTDNAALRGIFS
tara:strand:+ start:100 stop:807 length:708 start_codon:yes stop_codon:yes gene_type:complete